jgi:hypothetical protein
LEIKGESHEESMESGVVGVDGFACLA